VENEYSLSRHCVNIVRLLEENDECKHMQLHLGNDLPRAYHVSCLVKVCRGQIEGC